MRSKNPCQKASGIGFENVANLRGGFLQAKLLNKMPEAEVAGIANRVCEASQ
jgi:rhodanese-related sulfurtransferase